MRVKRDKMPVRFEWFTVVRAGEPLNRIGDREYWLRAKDHRIFIIREASDYPIGFKYASGVNNEGAPLSPDWCRCYDETIDGLLPKD